MRSEETAGDAGFDFGPMLTRLAPVLDSVDLAVCHLETPFAPEGEELSTFPLFGVPAEVAAAYRVGVHHLQRPDSPRFVSIAESDRPVVQVPVGGDLIHAPTGAVLVQFRWVCLDGRVNARVGHFEQPVFAWR